MASSRSRARAPRSVNYDPDLVENWTLQRLRDECERLRIDIPSNCRRSILIRTLRNSDLSPHSHTAARSTQRSQRSERLERQDANDASSSHNASVQQQVTRETRTSDETQNGRLDAMESVLSEVLDSLASIRSQMTAMESKIDRTAIPAPMQQHLTPSVIADSPLPARERTLSTSTTQEIPVTAGLSNRSEQSTASSGGPDFNLASAYSNFGLTSPFAAGSPDHFGPRPSAVRSRFGYSSQSIPEAVTIAPALRNAIIQGRDVNLAALLVPYFRGSGDNAESSHPVDTNVTRETRAPNKPLTLSQFIEAFATYKSVMCAAFPHRRQELDLYEVAIVHMASRHPGPGFYDYHCQFSARAASLLRYSNICLDWSVRDEILYNNIFAGRPVNQCSNCLSSTHDSNFCLADHPPARHETHRSNRTPRPAASDRTRTADIHGRPRVFHQNKEVCNNFNGDAGCKAQNCTRAHVCVSCKAEHPQSACPLGPTPPPAKKR